MSGASDRQPPADSHDAAAVRFPVCITFDRGVWYLRLHLTDATGGTIGHISFARRGKGRLPIFRDASLEDVIYSIRWEHGFAQWFETAAGHKLGGYSGIPSSSGKFVIIGGQPRVRFDCATPWLDFFESVVPSLPFLNALTGTLLQPTYRAVRHPDGQPVLEITKRRRALTTTFTIHQTGTLHGDEQECLLLATIVECLWMTNVRHY